MTIGRNRILAIIGPSGCGKTTLLRCFNRIHELHPKNRYEGAILFHGKNILDRSFDVVQLRSKIGMVFQKPTPFPMSIQSNIAYALSIKGISNKTEVNDRIEKVLKKVGLWSEIAHRLKMEAFELSDGQQQRLVIARALAVEPEVILFDEPTNALDPLSTSKIEELLFELKNELTILIVTHNMQQAARMSDDTAFLYMGELVEFDETNSIFTNPVNKLTEDYVTGRFG
jgi:phosphate transport system ATP-binding protein